MLDIQMSCIYESDIPFYVKRLLMIRSFWSQPRPKGSSQRFPSDDALKHLNKMRSERNEDLCLRIGVKQGGCSGMSYTMEFENRANTIPDDSVIEYNGFVIGMDYPLFALASQLAFVLICVFILFRLLAIMMLLRSSN